MEVLFLYVWNFRNFNWICFWHMLTMIVMAVLEDSEDVLQASKYVFTSDWYLIDVLRWVVFELSLQGRIINWNRKQI